jgi:hypothetical protein
VTHLMECHPPSPQLLRLLFRRCIWCDSTVREPHSKEREKKIFWWPRDITILNVGSGDIRQMSKYPILPGEHLHSYILRG